MSPEQFLQSYLTNLTPDHVHRSARWGAEGWGDSSAMADELGALIASGIKTATCSALWEYEFDGEALPVEGVLTVVLSGSGEPLCLVETVEVAIRRFDEVDTVFAEAEGEGDRSLAWWREAHRRFFSRVLPRIGREFDERMPLVCERFRKV